MSQSGKMNTVCSTCAGFSERIVELEAEVAALQAQSATLQAELAAAKKNSRSRSQGEN